MRRMARVLVVSNLFAPDERGGYEILCRQVCELLAARGHAVAVLTAAGARPAEAAYEVWPELVLTAGFDTADDRRRSRRAVVHRHNARATGAAIARHRADAVLFFSLRRLTLGPARAVEGAAIARLFVVNDAWPLAYRPRPRAPGLRPTVGRALDLSLWASTTTRGSSLSPALVLSESLRDELEQGGVILADAQVSYQGISTERFHPAAVRATAAVPRILFAGQLHAYKGVHHLLAAAELLEQRLSPGAFSLTIAGRGDEAYARALRDQARTLRCDVEWLGHVPFDRMPEVYRAHDLLVFPSIWNEPLGLTHLEAMACGVPAVVARSGGCGELIDRCPHVVSYPPGDVVGLADALVPLLQSAARRRELGEASRRWVARHAALDGYVGRMESILGIRGGASTSAPTMPR